MMFSKYVCRIFGHKEHLDDHFYPETICERCKQSFKPRPISELSNLETYFLGILVSHHGPEIIHLAHEQRLSGLRIKEK
jgi:hypothetical protein